MLAHSKQMQALTNPLYKHFGINSCYYIQIYQSGESLYLTNCEEFQTNLIQNHLTKHQRFSDFSILEYLQRDGFYLVDAEPAIFANITETEVIATEEHDLHHFCISLDKIKTPKGNARQPVSKLKSMYT